MVERKNIYCSLKQAKDILNPWIDSLYQSYDNRAIKIELTSNIIMITTNKTNQIHIFIEEQMTKESRGN